MANLTTKYCRRCDQYLDVSAFRPTTVRKRVGQSYYRTYCRKCEKSYSRDYNEKYTDCVDNLHIYLIDYVIWPACKIGVTHRKPEFRLKDIQVYAPAAKVLLFARIPNYKVEARVHRDFNSLRIGNSEVFAISGTQMLQKLHAYLLADKYVDNEYITVVGEDHGE